MLSQVTAIMLDIFFETHCSLKCYIMAAWYRARYTLIGQKLVFVASFSMHGFIEKQEIRSVEHGICPIFWRFGRK